MKRFVICFLFFLEFITLCEGCQVAPRYWCDSREIAEQCGVTQQCERFVWSRSQALPVRLTLYYESLCPDCKDFFAEQLGPAFSKIGSIIDLSLVPYGNARETEEGGKWIFTCQHGGDECQGNLIETCAINIVGDMTKVFPFILCVETSGDKPENAAPKCAVKHQVDYAAIKECSESERGNALEHQMALATDRLNPPHTYVPWVTLNEEHTDKIQQMAERDLVRLICDTYQGAPPAGCGSDTLLWKSAAEEGFADIL